jgi:hypothetical protein
VKVRSDAKLVPVAFVATRRKWYVVPGFSRVSERETLTGPVPEPALLALVFKPWLDVVPYSKIQLVACPFGVTVPLSLADVGVTEVAARVTTAGAPIVENVRSAPRLTPASLVATRRK